MKRTYTLKKGTFIWTVVATLLVAPSLAVAAPVVLKAGMLAPEGSPWMEAWYKVVDYVEENSPVPIKIKTYPGGVMGDEPAMVNKMKIGQLHIMGATVAGIRNLIPEILVLNQPFMFETYGEVDYAIEKLMPDFKKAADDHGYYLLSILDQGMIEAYSVHRATTPEEWLQQRVWVWSADPVGVKLVEKIDVNAVMLPVPEVMGGLQTGLIDAMFNSPTALVALQWHTMMNYYYPFVLRYDPAILVASERAMRKLGKDRAAVEKVMQEAADKFLTPFLDELRATEQKTRELLPEYGLEKVEFNEDDLTDLKEEARSVRKDFIGDLYSKELLDKTVNAVKEYRAKQAKK